MTDADLQSLLGFVQQERRVCPMPQRWNELWQMLPDSRRVGTGWEPPLPLILGGWWESSNQSKRERLAEHLRWADIHGILKKTDLFLRTLPENEWLHEGDGPA